MGTACSTKVEKVEKNGERKSLKIHLVHSVKGGCGKTAFSLFKAMSCAHDSEKDSAEVLYFDADFKGTSIKTLIYGSDKETFLSVNTDAWNNETRHDHSINGIYEKLQFKDCYNPNTLNDFIEEYQKNYVDIVQHGAIIPVFENSEEIDVSLKVINSYIDFLFSSSKAEDKSLYEYEAGSFTSQKLTQGCFKSRIRKLLEQIYDYDSTYKDIVIDMPPGEEAYSKTLISTLKEWAKDVNKKGKKGKIELYYYAVTTNDRGHIWAEASNLAAMLHSPSKGSEFEEIIIVMNELRDKEFKESYIGTVLTTLRKQLSDIQASLEKKIFYCKNSYSDRYYQYCRENNIDAIKYVISDKKELFSQGEEN